MANQLAKLEMTKHNPNNLTKIFLKTANEENLHELGIFHSHSFFHRLFPCCFTFCAISPAAFICNCRKTCFHFHFCQLFKKAIIFTAVLPVCGNSLHNSHWFSSLLPLTIWNFVCFCMAFPCCNFFAIFIMTCGIGSKLNLVCSRIEVSQHTLEIRMSAKCYVKKQIVFFLLTYWLQLFSQQEIQCESQKLKVSWLQRLNSVWFFSFSNVFDSFNKINLNLLERDKSIHEKWRIQSKDTFCSLWTFQQV